MHPYIRDNCADNLKISDMVKIAMILMGFLLAIKIVLRSLMSIENVNTDILIASLVLNFSFVELASAFACWIGSVFLLDSNYLKLEKNACHFFFFKLYIFMSVCIESMYTCIHIFICNIYLIINIYSFHILLYIYLYIYIYIYIIYLYTYTHTPHTHTHTHTVCIYIY